MDCWHRLPNKGFFLLLLAAWSILFQLVGNSTRGYIHTSSLFFYLFDAFTAGGKALLDSEEGYGMLMPLVVLGLFWMKRKELLGLRLGVWWPGLLLLLSGVGLHLLGFLCQQPRISVVGFFVGIYGLTGLAWGQGWLRASFFPFFLFVFCVPLGTLALPVTFRLRLLVSELVTVIAHNVLVINVIRHGTSLINPTEGYQYEVAAACSGIRSMMATLALSVILAFFSFRTWWKRLLVIGSAFPLALLGNLLRMLTIVIAAELGGQQWGNYVHDGGPLDLFSLLPYVPAFAGLLLLEHYLHRPRAIAPAPEAASQEGTP
ncbi:MAG TPA: exosortase/archaeosortase family protein [Verrucomicrobiae bacterium]|nr:exosortase/archaeosortase family protein [Verrucomicrobiae bacterium]